MIIIKILKILVFSLVSLVALDVDAWEKSEIEKRRSLYLYIHLVFSLVSLVALDVDAWEKSEIEKRRSLYPFASMLRSISFARENLGFLIFPPAIWRQDLLRRWRFPLNILSTSRRHQPLSWRLRSEHRNSICWWGVITQIWVVFLIGWSKSADLHLHACSSR